MGGCGKERRGSQCAGELYPRGVEGFAHGSVEFDVTVGL